MADFLVEIGYFYHSIDRISESEKYFLKCLDLYRLLVKQNQNQYLPKLANSLQYIGQTYFDKYDNLLFNYEDAVMFDTIEPKKPTKALEIYLKKAIDSYAEAIEVYRKLALQNPNAFLPLLAEVLDDIAGCYKRSDQVTEAEQYHLESVSIYRKLADKNPVDFNLELMQSLKDVAFFI